MRKAQLTGIRNLFQKPIAADKVLSGLFEIPAGIPHLAATVAAVKVKDLHPQARPCPRRRMPADGTAVNPGDIIQRELPERRAASPDRLATGHSASTHQSTPQLIRSTKRSKTHMYQTPMPPHFFPASDSGNKEAFMYRPS